VTSDVEDQDDSPDDESNHDGLSEGLGNYAIGDVHLVFFLHVTSGPDNANNAMALAFGLFIVILIIGGSLNNLHAMNQNMGMHGMAM
jgi:hypothetical protein